ncbi:hypothetical protein GGR51DRAFT_522787 [Nemania sp. FL0031]|nr:hypothetical protein GGR51DRAFT_522787 [Nemania sp. FL0031]
MTDSSEGDSRPSVREGEDDAREVNSNVSRSRDLYNEQRVYIETNLETLIRIHTMIKRSGLKFSNQAADDALKRTEEQYQLQKADVGEHQAMLGENGKHEKFRRYLTNLVLWNGYRHNLIQKISWRIDQLRENLNHQGQQDREFLLQKKLLIVIRAYFVDPARLSAVQQRLINASVVRRNRLIHAGNVTKASFEAENQSQAESIPIIKSIAQPAFLAGQAQSIVTNSQPLPLRITSIEPKKSESEAGKSFVAQPATSLESKFSITGALVPRKATKSAATKMSARIGHLDYPECPVKHGQFSCPYCPIILTEEYTKKEKWRGHIAQDLCPYICVFEDCESPEEMFTSTYEWMSHMAKSHSKTEWVCLKCTKHSNPDVQDTSVLFKTPKDLEEHLVTFHAFLNTSELDPLVDAGKHIVGIQRVRCPLCRSGLVTLERDEDDDGMAPRPIAGHEIGMVQLEEDEHIATHIHEFALHSFPSPEEAWSEDTANFPLF